MMARLLQPIEGVIRREKAMEGKHRKARKELKVGHLLATSSTA